MLDPRYALSICLAATGSIWILLIAGAAAGVGFSPLGYTLLGITMCSSMMLYWRYRGIFW
ncbi:MAG: hypothetical protein ACM3YO_05570 [Bacteroidota bacterium]